MDAASASADREVIAVGWLIPVVALVGYALIALFFIFPFRLRRRIPAG